MVSVSETSTMPTAAAASVARSAALRQRERGGGQPGRERPDRLHAVGGEVEGGRDHRRRHHGDEHGGDLLGDAGQAEQQGQGAEADEERRRVRLVEVREEGDDVVDEGVPLGREAEELGELADDDRDGQPVHVADLDLLGEQVGDEPELAEAQADLDEADHERQHAGHGDRAGRVVGHEQRRDGGEDERRDGRVRAEDQHARRPEQRVHDEAGDGRVEAGDRRQPGQLRVRQPLRHEDRREDDAGDEVEAQPRRLVRAQHADAGHGALSRLFFGPASACPSFVATRAPSPHRSVTNGSICPWPIQRTSRARSRIGDASRARCSTSSWCSTPPSTRRSRPRPRRSSTRRCGGSRTPPTTPSCTWAIAALLFAAGGKKGRRAAVTGMAAVGLNSFVVNIPMKFAGHRPRPERGVVRFEEARHVKMPTSTSFPSGHSASGFAFAAGVAEAHPGARRPAPRPGDRGRLLARPLRGALPRRRHRRVAGGDGRRRGHGAGLAGGAQAAPRPPSDRLRPPAEARLTGQSGDERPLEHAASAGRRQRARPRSDHPDGPAAARVRGHRRGVGRRHDGDAAGAGPAVRPRLRRGRGRSGSDDGPARSSPWCCSWSPCSS